VQAWTLRLQGDIRVLADRELDALFGAAERGGTFGDLRTRLAMQLALDAALRAVEVVSLRHGDIVWEPGKQVARVKLLGKGRKIRDVWIGETTLAYLADYLRVLGGHHASTDPLFIGRAGEQLTASGLEQDFARVREAAGLKGKTRLPLGVVPARMVFRDVPTAADEPVGFHDLRRTFCAHFAEAGGSVEEMARILGHAPGSLQLLHDHYYRPSDKAIRDAQANAAVGDGYQDGRLLRSRRAA